MTFDEYSFKLGIDKDEKIITLEVVKEKNKKDYLTFEKFRRTFFTEEYNVKDLDYKVDLTYTNISPVNDADIITLIIAYLDGKGIFLESS